MYGLFAVATLLWTAALRPLGRRLAAGSLVAAILWIVLGPVFQFVVPTSWDGAMERFPGLVMVAWVAMMSWLLLAHARPHATARAVPRARPHGHSA